MAYRFVVADNNVIKELKTSSENSNTRKSTILYNNSTILWDGVFIILFFLILKRYIHCVNLYFSIALAGYP